MTRTWLTGGTGLVTHQPRITSVVTTTAHMTSEP